jgi:hypothetical protein
VSDKSDKVHLGITGDPDTPGNRNHVEGKLASKYRGGIMVPQFAHYDECI